MDDITQNKYAKLGPPELQELARQRKIPVRDHRKEVMIKALEEYDQKAQQADQNYCSPLILIQREPREGFPWTHHIRIHNIQGANTLGPITLGLELDQAAASQGYFLISVVIEIPPSVAKDVAGEQLAQIARQAYLIMKNREKDLWLEFEHITNVTLKSRQRTLPTTMSVMLIKQRLFIASSVRKAPSISWIKAEKSARESAQGGRSYPPGVHNMFVVKALQQSNMYTKGSVSHRTQANCAEMVCLHLWSLMGASMLEDLKDAQIVTVWRDGEADSVEVKSPCEGGCEKVLQTLGVKYVQEMLIPDGDFPMDCLQDIAGPRYHFSIIPPPSFDVNGSGWAKNGLYHDPTEFPSQPQGHPRRGPRKFGAGVSARLDPLDPEDILLERDWSNDFEFDPSSMIDKEAETARAQARAFSYILHPFEDDELDPGNDQETISSHEDTSACIDTRDRLIPPWQ
ncbi:MAG: hypothetical protein Q9221_008650 [Calogaya cf. arnoldii]